MTEESTPEISTAEDTSQIATNSETVVNQTNDTTTTPEVALSEPETVNNDTADKTETPTNNELLAGKFKTVDDLTKAYKEAEKYVTKSKELEKQLQTYRDIENKAKEEREAVARRQGFNDAEQQQLDFDVKNHEFLAYVDALSTLTGEAYKKAYEALGKYQNSLNPRDLMTAQAYFSPATVSKISGDTALYHQKRIAEYRKNAEQKRFEAVKQNLEEFAKETEGWLDPKERQDIIGEAIKLTGGNVDLRQLKTLIDSVEKSAVDRYIAEQKAVNENKAVQNSLQTPTGANNVDSGEHWFTKEEYNKLTPEQESKNYDKIVRQIQLENEGKLPRELTR